ncbi:MAG: hypothetical protein EB127_18865 [Alphaproteobacteria bacterium]|nr:hypothetical protein [Alphaproteobacteria bacterium]
MAEFVARSYKSLVIPQIKDTPTVLDNIPLDIIQYEIFPLLSYEERIHLNRCLPPWDRISKKMDKMSIEKHEHDFIVDSIKSRVKKFIASYSNNRFKLFIGIFKLLQKPRYFNIIRDTFIFREMIINKINDFTERLIHMRLEMELCTRIKFVSEITKLRKKINISGPYTEVSYKHVKKLTFQ